MDQTIHRSPPAAPARSRGRVRVPGDKSISHRALILGALTVGRNPHHRPARGRGRHQHRQGDARARRHASSAPGRAPGGSTGSASRASRSRPRRSISAIPAPAAAWSSGRLRAARSPRPSTAMPRCARGRCGACSTRSSAWARGRSSVAEGGRLPLTLAGRARPDSDRLSAAGRLRAAQIRRAARRPRGAGRDGGDRAGGDARPHRAHAAPFRRDRAGRDRRRARPPHHAHRPAGARPRAGHGAGRSLVRRVPAGRRR